MSDNQKTEEQNSDLDREEGRTSEPDGKNSWETEKLELIARRDSANKKARILQKELEDLKSQLGNREKEDAEKSGDLNRIRSEFQKDLDKLATEKQQLADKLRRSVIQSQFNALASGIFTDEAVKKGVVWKLLQDDLDINEDDEGNLIPVAKSSALSFEAFLKKYAEENPFLAKNPAKGGTGAKGSSQQPNGGVTIEELAKLPDKGRQWLKENPAEAKRLLANIKLGG